MKWIGKIILMYVVLNSCESANEKITFNSNYSIIPKPQQLSITEGFLKSVKKHVSIMTPRKLKWQNF